MSIEYIDVVPQELKSYRQVNFPCIGNPLQLKLSSKRTETESELKSRAYSIFSEKNGISIESLHSFNSNIIGNIVSISTQRKPYGYRIYYKK